MTATILFRPGEWTDAAELAAAREHFPVATVRRGVVGPGLVIARYAGVPFYEELAQDLAELGVRLVNSVAEHRFAADPRCWAPHLAGLTPRTWTTADRLPSDVAFVVAPVAPSLGDDDVGPALAPDREAARALVAGLADEPLVASRGVVIREHVPLRAVGEDLAGNAVASQWRFFACDGEVLAAGLASSSDLWREPAPPPAPAEEMARVALARIGARARFVAVDVAERAVGGWIVAALSDGSDALLGLTDPRALYEGLARALARNP